MEAPKRAAAARRLIGLLTPLIADEGPSPGPMSSARLPEHVDSQAGDHREILSAIQELAVTMVAETPIVATFHDGQVHDPLGGGAYAFQYDIVEPVLLALVLDESIPLTNELCEMDVCSRATEAHGCGAGSVVHRVTRPIVLHVGAQPNNSPHAGTLIVWCYAFSLAREIRGRMEDQKVITGNKPQPVSVQVTFVDTAPVKDQRAEIDGIQYQRSYRDVVGALESHMGDYQEVLSLLSNWSGIPFTTNFQSDFFSQPTMPSILRYIVAHHDLLGRQLSPKHGVLALRAACPMEGCGLAEKHGRLNVYNYSSHEKNRGKDESLGGDASITFHCPHHGPHTISISEPADVVRLEANATARNLIRSMSHLLDTAVHHVRITGADYAGMYQEVFLYRPLAAWSAATGLAAGRTPHILYAPLIVDWSGAKLSKSLYVRERGYGAMRLFGTDGLCSFAQLKCKFLLDGDDGTEGLRRIWQEVNGWLKDPRKLFRTFSVDYLQKVILDGESWTGGRCEKQRRDPPRALISH